MKKKDLFQASRGHHEFINARVFVFVLGEDEFSMNPNGNLIVLVIKF